MNFVNINKKIKFFYQLKIKCQISNTLLSRQSQLRIVCQRRAFGNSIKQHITRFHNVILLSFYLSYDFIKRKRLSPLSRVNSQNVPRLFNKNNLIANLMKSKKVVFICIIFSYLKYRLFLFSHYILIKK